MIATILLLFKVLKPLYEQIDVRGFGDTESKTIRGPRKSVEDYK